MPHMATNADQTQQNSPCRVSVTVAQGKPRSTPLVHMSYSMPILPAATDLPACTSLPEMMLMLQLSINAS